MGRGRVEALSLEVKRQRRESEDSSSSSAEVMNEWSPTATPPAYFNGVQRQAKFHLITPVEQM
jgi:hypothetical protein